jgi:tetratricopeptide (TPR) repeat protein
MSASNKLELRGHVLVGAIGIFGAAAIFIVGATQDQGGTPPPVLPSRSDDPSTLSLIEDVDLAIARMDTEALLQKESMLGLVADSTTLRPKAAVAQLARARSVATRALEQTLFEHLLPAAHPPGTAEKLADEGQRIVDALEPRFVANPDIVALEARLALARGDDPTTRHPTMLLPDFFDRKLQILVASRPLWAPMEGSIDRDEIADDLIERLQGNPESSATMNIVLALAHRQRGQLEAAVTQLDAVLNVSPNQALAKELRAAWTAGDTELEGSAEPAAADAAAEQPQQALPAPAPKIETKVPAVASEAKSRSTQASVDHRDKVTPPASSQPAKGGSYEQLVRRGCDLVSKRKANEGLDLLREAHDLKPGATDVTLCMAEAYAALGRSRSALAMAERVLARNPQHERARLLAARSAAKANDVRGATMHYRAVLQRDPNHGEAKAYVDNAGKPANAAEGAAPKATPAGETRAPGSTEP